MAIKPPRTATIPTAPAALNTFIWLELKPSGTQVLAAVYSDHGDQEKYQVIQGFDMVLLLNLDKINKYQMEMVV